MSSLVNN